MKIKTEINFHKLHKAGKLPSGIPSSPRTVYKKEWKGWGDFLGTGRVANQNKKFRSSLLHLSTSRIGTCGWQNASMHFAESGLKF